MTAERVVTYIDGYNLYYGLKQAGLDSSRWLDLEAMSRSLLKPSQQLKQAAHGHLRIPDNKIRANRLPDPVITPEGTVLSAPDRWTPSRS